MDKFTQSQLDEYDRSKQDPSRPVRTARPAGPAGSGIHPHSQPALLPGPSEAGRTAKLGSHSRSVWSTDQPLDSAGHEPVALGLSEMTLEELLTQPQWRRRGLMSKLIEVWVVSDLVTDAPAAAPVSVDVAAHAV